MIVLIVLENHFWVCNVKKKKKAVFSIKKWKTPKKAMFRLRLSQHSHIP